MKKSKIKIASESFDFMSVSYCSGQEWIVSAPDVLACINACVFASLAIRKIPEKKRTVQELYLLSEFDRILQKEAAWMTKLEEVNAL